jgi:uncharacterized protein (UPF0276 family)
MGWRNELALFIERRSDLGFIELTSENFPLELPLPDPVNSLIARGITMVPHGLSLSLGSASRVDRKRLANLAAQAQRVGAPLVSEHIAFVRTEGEEAGHLLPVARTKDNLRILTENISEAMSELPVPLALENIATLFEWPDAEYTEPEFLCELLDRTGAMLLLDIENLYANSVNHRFDAAAYLDLIGLERVAYCHIAGGMHGQDAYHDTHAHPTPPEVFALLEYAASRADLPGYLLERDGAYPPAEVMTRELDEIKASVGRGNAKREAARAR